MKRYQLPDILGGGVYEPLTSFKSKAGDDWRVRFSIPDVGLVDVPIDALAEVAPPLWPEPPVGSVVLFGGEAVQRFEDNELADDPNEHWAGVGYPARWTWARLIEINGEPPVLLVPAPEPVTLPWSCVLGPDSTAEVTAEAGNVVDLNTATGYYAVGVRMSPDLAREKARALWAAAHAAEAQS